MSDLLEKLNVLLRAGLNSLTAGSGERPSAVRLTAEKLGTPKEVDREIGALRKQLNAAITQQEALQARLEDMERQIAEYVRQADAALQAEDEPRARYLITQKQRLEQRVRTQSETLERYRSAAADLMEQVNTLEALVSDARRTAEAAADAPLPESLPARTPALAEVLRSVRERVEETLAPRPKPPTEDPPATPTAPTKPAPNKPDEDDLAKRRARLSLPD